MLRAWPGLLLLFACGASAQVSAPNTAAVTPPAGIDDPAPGDNSHTAEVSVKSLVPVQVVKTAVPASGTMVQPGQSITYTVAVTVAGAPLDEPLTLVDTTSARLTFVEVTGNTDGKFQCSGGLTCILPAGTVAGTYDLVYTARVDADATVAVDNVVTATNPAGGDPEPVCAFCATTHPVAPPVITVEKSAAPAPGTVVAPEDTIVYTLTVTVGTSGTTAPLVLTDTLSAGLTYDRITADTGDFIPGGSGRTRTFTLPADAPPGIYTLSYEVAVDADATGTVGNSVVATGGGGTNPPACTACSTAHPITPPAIRVTKTATPGQMATVWPGDAIHYEIVVEVTGAYTTTPLVLVDTLDAGLAYGTVTHPGGFTVGGSGQARTFTLPAGTAPGRYRLDYRATVNADATGRVGNQVVASGGGGEPPDCVQCRQEHTIAPPEIAVAKHADPVSGSFVKPGQTITWTLTATVATSSTTEPLVLIDTLAPGLSFGAVTANSGGFVVAGSGATRTFTLPAGAVPGTYAVSYTAAVEATATGRLGNQVVASGGGPVPPVCHGCESVHEVPLPGIEVSKYADPEAGTEVVPGQSITYTVAVAVVDAATAQVLTLTDTLDAGLAFGRVIDAGPFTCSGGLVCTLPAGTLPGEYTLRYTAVVDTHATGAVGNSVTATRATGEPPRCVNCRVEHPVTKAAIVVSKSADPDDGSEVAPGDAIRYSLRAVISNSETTQPLTLTDTPDPGLVFDRVLDAGAFSCSGSLTCVLPAGTAPGTYALSYAAKVAAEATGAVGNHVTAANPPGGDPDPHCALCDTWHELPATHLTVTKAADPATGSEVAPGSTITYTVSAVVTGAATTQPLTLRDAPGDGLTFGTVTDAGAFTCSASITCVLPAGSLPGTYRMHYTATVNADAVHGLANHVVASNPAGDPDPECIECATEHRVPPSLIVVNKTADPAAGSELEAGQLVTYTLTVSVANSATTQDVTLTDALGKGLVFGRVTDEGAFTCSGSLVCVLPAGALPGIYQLSYTASVAPDITAGTIRNHVTASIPSSSDPPPVCNTCAVEHPVHAVGIVVRKSADPADGSEVAPGSPITYTVSVTVSHAATTQDLTLQDRLGEGLQFDRIVDAGEFTCSGSLDCTLPAGALPGTYELVYVARVSPDATGSVRNELVASNAPDGDPEPDCAACVVENPIPESRITVVKNANPAAGSEVRAGDVLTYTLTATVADAATTQPLQLTDVPGAGLEFGEVLDAGEFTCVGSLVCTLPAGRLPGTYSVRYTATVAPTAQETLSNHVSATGGSGVPPDCEFCTTEHALAEPGVVVRKDANPASGTEVRIGETIEYTLSATITDSALRQPLQLLDVPGQGLTVAQPPAGCTRAGEGEELLCTLPAGTVPGTYTFSYAATVNAEASGEVLNSLRGSYPDSSKPLECVSCETSHPVLDQLALRVTKTATPRQAHVGDLVRYTVTVENVGQRDWHGGAVLDTPPAGFSYVEGSFSGSDADGAVTLAAGRYPLRIEGMDVAAGGSATLVYLLKVGAGVRDGTYVNHAVALDADGTQVSNDASAEVLLDGDPLLDNSLVFGTVFDDRDGDGWQDSAMLSRVRVRGGFAGADYVPGTTTVQRGEGAPQPVPDASVPLLRGLDLGDIAGRESEGEPAEVRQVIVRQHLRALDFSDDFVLESREGLRLTMGRDGNTVLEKKGVAADGFTAALPRVERHVARVADGYEVAYVIANAGIDERGIPGVRLATVEGLLMETDRFGRYHLVDLPGGDARLGGNVIVKVDPATLPPGAKLTTENPLVRRTTQGMPARFSFGVHLPTQVLLRRQLVELELGEVMFAPRSAEVRPAAMPVLIEMAKQVDRYGRGEIVIAANGETQQLAFARALAVRGALRKLVDPQSLPHLDVVLRTEVADPGTLLAGIAETGPLVGSVLFDTDKSDIRPEFQPLLDAIAARLNATGGGIVHIVGHTDIRASHAYNAALGLRRATAVFEALRERLRPEVRDRIQVDSSEDTTTPLDAAELGGAP